VYQWQDGSEGVKWADIESTVGLQYISIKRRVQDAMDTRRGVVVIDQWHIDLRTLHLCKCSKECPYLGKYVRTRMIKEKVNELKIRPDRFLVIREAEEIRVLGLVRTYRGDSVQTHVHY